MYRDYFNFDGFTTRKEFWLFYLFFIPVVYGGIFYINLSLPYQATMKMNMGEFSPLHLLMVLNVYILIPQLALLARRFRDAGFKRYFAIIAFMSFTTASFNRVVWILCIIVVIFMATLSSAKEGNRFRESTDLPDEGRDEHNL